MFDDENDLPFPAIPESSIPTLFPFPLHPDSSSIASSSSYFSSKSHINASNNPRLLKSQYLTQLFELNIIIKLFINKIKSIE